MARVLAEGTGAEWSQVWLVVGDRPRLAATWPPEATRERAAGDPATRSRTRWPGRRSLAVRHGGERARRAGRPGARAPPAHVGRGTPVRGAGQARPGRSCAAPGCAPSSSCGAPSCRLAPTSCARRASGWSTLQDDERRLLERDIHDGAQQHLVALAVNLRLAQTLAAAVAGARGRHPRRPGAGRRRRRSTPWSTCPAASTRGCSRTTGWPPRCARRSAPARSRSRSSPHGVGRLRRRPSRRRRTSAAWRPCRTPPSTRAPPTIRVELRRTRPGR